MSRWAGFRISISKAYQHPIDWCWTSLALVIMAPVLEGPRFSLVIPASLVFLLSNGRIRLFSLSWRWRTTRLFQQKLGRVSMDEYFKGCVVRYSQSKKAGFAPIGFTSANGQRACLRNLLLNLNGTEAILFGVWSGQYSTSLLSSILRLRLLASSDPRWRSCTISRRSCIVRISASFSHSNIHVDLFVVGFHFCIVWLVMTG